MQKRLNRSRCRLGCGLEWASGRIYGGAHWRHLVNTIKPSMCGDDAALWQITSTTCFLFDYLGTAQTRSINRCQRHKLFGFTARLSINICICICIKLKHARAGEIVAFPYSQCCSSCQNVLFLFVILLRFWLCSDIGATARWLQRSANRHQCRRFVSFLLVMIL